MNVLEVRGLTKAYPKFTLSDLSFSVREGSVMGFIGRNGAGKTTTLKSILHIVHPDAGEITYFGMPFASHEAEIKQLVGYAGGAVDYYRRKPVKKLLEVTKRFYPAWDDALCKKYMDAFSLDAEKTPAALSEGMRVKLNLTLALSHGAKLLVLDEPTSGLDPVSRAELLDVFRFLRSQGVAVLFSTHITSDLEKCADDITYIAKGKRIASEPLPSFLARCRETGAGNTLDEIMVHYEKEDLYEAFAE